MEKTCFIVCPIGSEGSDTRKRSDQVLRHIIEKVCKAKQFKAIRVDKINDTDTINNTIIDYLKNSELVIADLTDSNPNAFFEIGFRHALGKPLIQIFEEGQTLPFDVAGIRSISYNLTDPDKLEGARDKISQTIDAICIDSAEEASNLALPNEIIQPNHNLNSHILTALLNINDNIDSLRDEITQKDTENTEKLISIFADKLQESAPSNTEGKAMEIFFKELIKNPNKTMNMVSQISKFAPPK